MKTPTIVAALAIIFGGSAVSLAQPNARGAIELSNGTEVPQNPSLPKRDLADRSFSLWTSARTTNPCLIKNRSGT